MSFKKLNFSNDDNLLHFKNYLREEHKGIHKYLLDNSLPNVERFGPDKIDDFEWLHVKNAYHKTEEADTQSKLNFVKRFSCLRELTEVEAFKNINLPQKRFKVDMHKPFVSDELSLWTTVKQLPSAIEAFQLKVIHGKKVGRTLGIPTGQLTSESRNQRVNYPTPADSRNLPRPHSNCRFLESKPRKLCRQKPSRNFQPWI